MIIHLSDKASRSITVLKQTIFLDFNGKVFKAQELNQRLYGEVSTFFNSEDEVRILESVPLARENL
jgi:hypothetical protein